MVRHRCGCERQLSLVVSYCGSQRPKRHTADGDGYSHFLMFHHCRCHLALSLRPSCLLYNRLNLLSRWPQREGRHVRWNYSSQEGELFVLWKIWTRPFIEIYSRRPLFINGVPLENPSLCPQNLQAQKTDNQQIKVKLRRLEEDNAKREKQIEELLDPTRVC